MSYLIKSHCCNRRIFATCLVVFLTSCGSTEQTQPAVTQAIDLSPREQIAQQISEAESRTGTQRTSLLLQAAERSIRESLFQEASSALDRIGNANSLSNALKLQIALARAEIAKANNQLPAAIRWLSGSLTDDIDASSPQGANLNRELGELYQLNGDWTNALRTYAQITPYFESDLESDVFDQIWFSLQAISANDLETLAGNAASYELRGWIELARVYRNTEFSIRGQLDALDQWQRVWSSHSAANRLPRALADLQSIWSNRPRHIALLLPTQQQSGITIQEGFFSAYYESLDTTREVPRVTVLDSTAVENVFDLYDQALDQGADLVIGPLNKTLVNQYSQRPNLPVPTLALNYLDEPSTAPTNLFQFGLAPEDEIRQIAGLAWEAGHRKVGVFTPDSEDYGRLQNAFAVAWQELGGEVVSATTFEDTTDYSDTVKRLMAVDSSEARAERILDLLPRNSIEFIPRRRQDIDFIFLIANPRQGRLIKPTLAFYFAENVPVYSMPSIYEGNANPNEDRDLNGVWFADAPWVLQYSNELKTTVTSNLRPASGQLQRLRALGIDSFRLYARLTQLAEGNINRVPGATGLLTILQDGRIQRELNIARFVNGEAELQPNSSSASD